VSSKDWGVISEVAASSAVVSEAGSTVSALEERVRDANKHTPGGIQTFSKLSALIKIIPKTSELQYKHVYVELNLICLLPRISVY
jgi:hypothetical protein